MILDGGLAMGASYSGPSVDGSRSMKCYCEGPAAANTTFPPLSQTSFPVTLISPRSRSAL